MHPRKRRISACVSYLCADPDFARFKPDDNRALADRHNTPARAKQSSIRCHLSFELEDRDGTMIVHLLWAQNTKATKERNIPTNLPSEKSGRDQSLRQCPKGKMNVSNNLVLREVLHILTGVTALSSSGKEQINMRNTGKRQTTYLIEASTNISPRDARKAGNRPIRDFFLCSCAAVDVCDRLPLALLLVVAGTTAVTCSYKVTVVTENS